MILYSGTKTKRCIICNNQFEYRIKPTHHLKTKSYRGKKMITCSKKCASVYDRIYKRIKNNLSKKKNVNNIKQVI